MITSSDKWKLSPCETDVMDAIVETGNLKDAAAMLRKSVGTVRVQLQSARDKIGATNMTLAAVAWDRYSRASRPRRRHDPDHHRPAQRL
jgi:DNA-binding NarL/FixJ family response regulator